MFYQFLKNKNNKNIIFFILLGLITQGFSFFYLSFLSYKFNNDLIGQVIFSQSLINIFVLFSQFGLPTFAIRFLTINKSELFDITQSIIQLRFIFTLLSVLFFLILLFFMNTPWKLIILIFSLDIIFNFISMDWFLHYQRKISYLFYARLLSLFFVVLFLFIFLIAPVGIYAYLLMFVLFNLFYYLFILKSLFKSKDIKFKVFNIFSFNCYKVIKKFNILKNSLYLFLATITDFALYNFGILYYADSLSPEDLSFIGIFLKLFFIYKGFVGAVFNAAYPRLSVFSKSKEKFSLAFKKFLKINLSFSVMVCFLLYFLLDYILFFFFDFASYDKKYLLKFLSLIIFVDLLNSQLGRFYLAKGLSRIVFYSIFIPFIFAIFIQVTFVNYGIVTIVFTIFFIEIIALILHILFFRNLSIQLRRV